MCSPNKRVSSTALSSPKRTGYESPYGSPTRDFCASRLDFGKQEEENFGTPVCLVTQVSYVTQVAPVTPLFPDTPVDITPPPFETVCPLGELGEGKGSTSTVRLVRTDNGQKVVEKTIVCQKDSEQKRRFKHQQLFSPNGEKKALPFEEVMRNVRVLEQRNPQAVGYIGTSVSDYSTHTEVKIYMNYAEPIQQNKEVAQQFLRMIKRVNQINSFSDEMTMVVNDTKAENLGLIGENNLCFLDFDMKHISEANTSCKYLVFPSLVDKAHKQRFRYLAGIWLNYQEMCAGNQFNLSLAREIVTEFTLIELESQLDSFLA